MVLLLSVLTISGCKKKKPAVPPPQAQAPTITQPQTAPQQTTVPPPATTQPQRQPAATQTPQTTTTPEKPKPRSRSNRSARNRRQAKPAEKPADKPATTAAQPSRTVVQQGGATQQQPAELTAKISHDAAMHQTMTTAQLLDSTDSNLKSLSRALTADEQAMVSHIRSFEDQSRTAIKEGDTERAYTLAMKAHLLSDELVKR